jgi:hypothetical protein
MDTNHKFSRMTNGWISPKFRVILSASPENEEPALEAVFDAPTSVWDQFSGTRKSLPNKDDRMVFVGQIADKFNHLMSTKKNYMEGELQKISQRVGL